MNKETNIDQEYVMSLRQGLGAKIKAKRIEAKVSQEQLGEAVGVQKATISKLEAGKFPTQIDMYIKIGLILDFKIDFI